MEYLDFELPIKELEEQYLKACEIEEESDVDVTKACGSDKEKIRRYQKKYL